MVKLDRCVGLCNTLNDLSNKVCVASKTEDFNLSVFNMITGINESKVVSTNINKKNVTCKTKDFYISLAFLLITIELLIAVSFYCYLMKYKAKQKHLLPFFVTNK